MGRVIATSTKTDAGTLLSPITRVSRGIKQATQLILYGIAAGHCQFEGCRRYLTAHHVDQSPGNYGEKAHIVAYRKQGPRGETVDEPEDINGIENLMLLCQPCHKKIDDHPQEYPRERLMAIKRDAEAFVRGAMAQRDDLRSHVIVFTAPIHGQPVVISDQRVREALRPRYAASQDFTRIDLNGISVGDTGAFYELAQQAIERAASRLHATGSPLFSVGHAAVFALGPIPLLVKLGAALTDKVDAQFFQRHQGEEDWTWKDGATTVRYRVDVPGTPKADHPVVALLSLSGPIDRKDLPPDLAASANIFELTLAEQTPVRTFLNTRDDLTAFGVAWIALQAAVSERFGVRAPIHLIPATPAPVAVLCGRARHPKAQGPLIVYDLRRDVGGYGRILEVSHEQR